MNSHHDNAPEPRGTLCLQTLAMPADANPNGDIFGGWLVSQMDLAGGVAGRKRARGRIATVAIDSMVFLRPLKVGDIVGFYTEVLSVGRSSIKILIEVWKTDDLTGLHTKLTEGLFTFVAIDDDGNTRPGPAGLINVRLRRAPDDKPICYKRGIPFPPECLMTDSTGNTTPNGVISLQTIAMPSDTNWNGDIFGGWLMAQMDLAGAVAARKRAHGRITTIAVDSMVFHHPVQIGDVISCYSTIERIGNTSMKIRIEVWETADPCQPPVKLTEGVFTYVAIDENGRPRAVPPEACPV